MSTDDQSTNQSQQPQDLPPVDDSANSTDDSASDGVQPAAADPLQQQAQVATQTPQPPVPQSGAGLPENAEDVDLIEKEWVEKAKNIVHGTVGNPHEQSRRLNNAKADYIKKRYGRDIKVDES